MNLGVLISLTLLFQTGSPSPSPSGQKTSTKTTQQSQGTKQRSPNTSAQSKENAPTNSSDSHAETQKPAKVEGTVRVVEVPPRGVLDTIGLVATIALAIFGVSGIIVAICTLLTMREQTSAMKDAVKAAEESAKAAKTSADVAEKGLVLLNRAYLAVSDWSIPGPIHEGNEKLEIRFCVVNPSETAARVEAIEFTLQHRQYTQLVGSMLTPKEKRPFAVQAENVRSGDVVLVD
jgi:hypothetical protein